MSRLSVSNMSGTIVSRTTRTLVIILLGLTGLVQPSQADDSLSVADSISKEIHKIFKTARSAICRVIAVDKHGVHNGTGFFIDPTGTIVTTYSLGGMSNDITIEIGSRKYAASRILADVRSGMVLLKVNAETDFLPLATAERLELASPVIAIGYAMDLEIAPTFGTVSGHDLKYLGRYLPVTHMRVNLPVARGQTGSPILNMDGEVVGVLVSAIDGGVACHALPVAVINKVSQDYAQYGAMKHGWVGVTVEPSIPGFVESSAKIAELDKASPVAETGIRVGDILLRIGQREVNVPADVLDASFFLSPGEEIELVVSREGKEMKFKSTVGDHPANPKLHAHSPTLLDGEPSQSLELGN